MKRTIIALTSAILLIGCSLDGAPSDTDLEAALGFNHFSNLDDIVSLEIGDSRYIEKNSYERTYEIDQIITFHMHPKSLVKSSGSIKRRAQEVLRAGVASNPFILDQFKTIAMSQLALDVPGATSLPGACSGNKVIVVATVDFEKTSDGWRFTSVDYGSNRCP